jgi:hypothetical protein
MQRVALTNFSLIAAYNESIVKITFMIMGYFSITKITLPSITNRKVDIAPPKINTKIKVKCNNTSIALMQLYFIPYVHNNHLYI